MSRIGIDARLTYYTQGGIAQYIQHLIHEFAAIASGHRLFILQSRKDHRDLTHGKWQRRVKCWTPAHNRYERYALAAEIARLRLDLLHSPDYIPPRSGRYRSVITIHDLAFLHYPEFMTGDSRRYYNGQIQDAVERADHIITVSEATRADILKLLDVSAEKITVIPEAASDRFRMVRNDKIAKTLERYNLPDSYILFVSTIEPRKNINGLLLAYDQLRQDLPDVPPLVLCGRRGWLYGEFYTLYTDLKLGDSVIWLEDASYDDLPAIYSGADVFCLPSHYEGFGLTALEAMACGAPVVVSERSSLPEVVGEAGILVNPDQPESIAEGLLHVLSNTQVAAELTRRGIKQAAKFSWRKAAEETLAVYEKVLVG
ncbi:MAG: glycosyltransferase family 4 protein [Anaerolineae bacterium]|nr:glycosyltransferase family 4 protein [Anaerolineae bacterium]